MIGSKGKTSKEFQEGNTVSFNKLGEYKLQVEGNKHKGNFALFWEIEIDRSSKEVDIIICAIALQNRDSLHQYLN